MFWSIIRYYVFDSPETGQALYQDPTTIERKAAPTGDLYAQPDKGRGSRRQPPTTPSAENATYQDPITIERQPAPTGDLYAQPEKKPKYSEVQKQNVSCQLFYLHVFSLLFSVLCTTPLFCISFLFSVCTMSWLCIDYCHVSMTMQFPVVNIMRPLTKVNL